MVRSSSCMNCLTCSSISGGSEKVMAFLFLGIDVLPLVITGHTLIMNV